MKKNTAILLVIGLAGVGAYFIFRKKKPIVQSLKAVQPKPAETLPQSQPIVATISEIGSQIQENSNQVQVQEMPNFGRPLVMMNDRPMMHYQNYVDVQKNSYFKPKEGAFFR